MSWNTQSSPVVEHSLADAHAAVAAQIHPLQKQDVPLTNALGRINASRQLASRPKPLYDQSSRDGFALSTDPHAVENGMAVFRIVGEVAAGARQAAALAAGEAVRIMTGAMTPSGCVRVVPFEVCSDRGGTVDVPEIELTAHQSYIRSIGSEVRAGKLLVPAGTRLLPDHLLMLAENGCFELPVYRQPDAAVVCTGSELVEAGGTVLPGQKISGNGVLLPALLRAHGMKCSWSVTVADEAELIAEQVSGILAERPDMIITTGGMGPGKFDLMEQVFEILGGSVVYNRLQVRPGKFTLFGKVGAVPFFALPGPPPAVRILFYELVRHALNRLQGVAGAEGSLVSAVLASSLSVKQTGHLNLKGAVVQAAEDGLRVHPAGRAESINAVIHLEEDRRSAEYGETVAVRLVGPLQGLAD